MAIAFSQREQSGFPYHNRHGISGSFIAGKAHRRKLYFPHAIDPPTKYVQETRVDAPRPGPPDGWSTVRL
jgi:hypothetical protein